MNIYNDIYNLIYVTDSGPPLPPMPHFINPESKEPFGRPNFYNDIYNLIYVTDSGSPSPNCLTSSIQNPKSFLDD